MSRDVDFIMGLTPDKQRKKKQPRSLGLCYARPRLETPNDESVIQSVRLEPRRSRDNKKLSEDGLYVSSDGPLTRNIVKPYQLGHQPAMDTELLPRPSHKLLEIAVRQVNLHSNSQRPEVTSILVLFREKTICKIPSPFNRKLYKLLINDASEPSNLTLRVQLTDGSRSDLPFPLPTRCVRDKKLEIEFSITDQTGKTHSGRVLSTISLLMSNEHQQEQPLCFYKSTNDPNDPHNCLSIHKIRKSIHRKPVDYFLLEDPALCLRSDEITSLEIRKKERKKLPDVVIIEQPVFSLWDISCGNWLQARRPLRPMSGMNAGKFRGGRDEVLSITVLRGIDIPVREESMQVQPIVQIQWGEIIQATTPAESSTPVWQQTMHFGMPKSGDESFIKVSLYDQHPVCGIQWLGEAVIPLEFHRNYQEIERWIGLSGLTSPIIRFGYVQSGPGSYTRIYILMRTERLADGEAKERSSLDSLSKAIQRCMGTPYKIPGTDSPDDAAQLAMLLMPLRGQYGPLTPKQALKLNKIDDYGRAALLASLLHGLGLEAYVIIASSQARNWAAFVVSLDDKSGSLLWDPESGDQYDFGDSRCSIIRVMRMISHQNIWKNLQKTTVISNVKFNHKITKDWQQLAALSAASAREVQILEIDGLLGNEEEDIHIEIERQLKDRLSQWRSGMGFTTVFNRHAVTLLRNYLVELSTKTGGQLDKNELRQLQRAYHIHGFVLNLRWSPINELLDLFASTRVQEVTGPVEFAIVCHVKRYVGRISSLWLAIVILRNRN